MDRNKMVRVLYRRSCEARARLAEENFGWEAVRKVIEDASARGHTAVLIEPPDAFDLSREKAAVATVVRLLGEHCAAEWVTSQKFTASTPPVVALRVSWAEKKPAV
jgi:hypothetical protein